MEMTTIKVSKKTNEILKAISEARGRRESKEQVILELVSIYEKEALRAKHYAAMKEDNG